MIKEMLCEVSKTFANKRSSASIHISRATSFVISLFILLVLQSAQGQPEEIRIRALGVEAQRGTVLPLDLLGSSGSVIRDSLPGRFWARLAFPVGDINGDGFSDMSVFWGTDGDVVFEELFLVYGGEQFPQYLDRDTISHFGSRLVQTATPFKNNFGASPRCIPAGDVDADGFADFFIGIRSYAPLEYQGIESQDGVEYKPGFVYLVYGGPQITSEVDLVHPPEGLRLVKFSSTKPNYTKLGEDMCTGGDLNGDGLQDFVFAAPLAFADESFPGQTQGPGRVYVLFGREPAYSGLIDLEKIGSSLPGVILQGDMPGEGFGMEVAFAGDVNGDGFDDLLIGSTGISNGQSRYISLVYGDSDLPGRLGANEVVLGGHGIRFIRDAGLTDVRQSLIPLGDINGDGFADLAIGEWDGDDLFGSPEGAAYVVFGQESFEQQVYLGSAVSFVGEGIGSSLGTIDYDGDGTLDLLIGACESTVDGVKRVGRVYVVRGPFEPGAWRLDSVWPSELDGVILTSEIPECLGFAVHNLGDMNGDRRADILITAPYEVSVLPNHFEPGLSPNPSVYVVFGTGGNPAPLRLDEISPSVSPLKGGNEVTLLGQGFNDEVAVQFGQQVADVLRVETSARMVVRVPAGKQLGPSEVVVTRGGESAEAGGLFRYVGPFYPDIPVKELSASGLWIAIDARSGKVNALLDHDGDGYGDIVVDSPDGLLIVYGRGMPTESLITVLPLEDPPSGIARLRLSDREGHEPFAVGDVNGDGVADLAVLSKDVVTMVFGGKRVHEALEVSTLLENGGASLISVSNTDKLGVSGGADFDGDGIGDVVLYRRGLEVNVLRGRATWPPLRGLALEPVFRSRNTSEENSFGRQAALIGDVDGDGLSELLIGVPGLHGRDSGNGFLVFGKAAWGINAIEDLVQSGEALQINAVKEMDGLGYGVTSVGDFNGDGVADLALSARAGSLDFAGELYVILGGKDLRGAPPLELAFLEDRGVRIRGEFGYDEAADLASVGDFNGDGRGDLLVSGGNLATKDNPFPARSFVVFGGAQGMVDLGKLNEKGFRITAGEQSQSVGGTDFNGDGFADAVVRGDTSLYIIFGSGVAVSFIRGDSNRSGKVDLSDAIAILNHLFVGTVDLKCKDAADANDTGRLDLTDAIFILGHLFLGNAEPPPPFPAPGNDPTEDALGCRG